MKIKISRSQWEKIGRGNGWIKEASHYDKATQLLNKIRSELENQLPEREVYPAMLGKLTGILIDIVAAFESAIDRGHKTQYLQSCRDLGIEGLIDKAIGLYEEKNRRILKEE